MSLLLVTLTNDPIAEDRALKPLVPSLQFWVFLGFLCLEVFEVLSWVSASFSLMVVSLEMLPRQKGQVGDGKHKVVGFGLL